MKLQIVKLLPFAVFLNATLAFPSYRGVLYGDYGYFNPEISVRIGKQIPPPNEPDAVLINVGGNQPRGQPGYNPPSRPNPFGPPSRPGIFNQPGVPWTFGKPGVPGVFGQPGFPGSFGGPNGHPNFPQPGVPGVFGQPGLPGTFGGPSGHPPLGQPGNPGVYGQPGNPGVYGQPGYPSIYGQPGVFNFPEDPNSYGPPPDEQGVFLSNGPVDPNAFGNPAGFGGIPGSMPPGSFVPGMNPNSILPRNPSRGFVPGGFIPESSGRDPTRKIFPPTDKVPSGSGKFPGTNRRGGGREVYDDPAAEFFPIIDRTS